MKKANNRELILYNIDIILMGVRDMHDTAKYTLDNLEKLKKYIGENDWKLSTSRKRPNVASPEEK